MEATPDPDLSPQQFGRAFKAFLDATVAAPLPSPLLERIASIPVSRGMVAAHGGCIRVESEPGAGTAAVAPAPR